MATFLVEQNKKWGKALVGEQVEIKSISLPAIVVKTKKDYYFTVNIHEIQLNETELVVYQKQVDRY